MKMHVFLTGASGWVGSAIVKDLIESGHLVTGLVRSQDKADALTQTGARAVQGTLDDFNLLREAASKADAVIHTAFNHDFSKFAESAEQDRRAIEAIGDALKGTNKPLLVTSALSGFGLSRAITESDAPIEGLRKSEAAAKTLADSGVRVATVRLAPSVHGIGDHGFIPIVIRIAREKGVSACIGEGKNLWAGVHRDDAARVYRLALETGVTKPVYHAVAEEGVPFKHIAKTIGRQLGLPFEPRDKEHFGWFASFAGADISASNEQTRKRLGWEPAGPYLLDDISQPDYYK